MTLSRSLDLETTVAEVGRLLVPRFADWCSLQLLRDGQLETVAVQHRDPETTEWARSMTGRLPDPHGRPHRRARTSCAPARSEIYPFIPAELVEATAVSDEHLAILRRLGLTSAIVAPLTGRDGIVGAVTLIHAESGRRYSDADVTFLEEMADRVALALDTAATFQQQSQRLAGVTLVAEAAQRAILAPATRRGPVRSRCRSATSPPRPRPRSAATSTRSSPGRRRYGCWSATCAARACRRSARPPWCSASSAPRPPAPATSRTWPARSTGRIRPYLLDTEEFVTAVFVDIEHDGRFHVVSCGHPAPVLLSRQGDIETVELDFSPPLGLGLGVDPVTARGKLDRGDRLLLFTDGLIEARSPVGEFIDPAPFLPEVARASFGTALDGLLASLRRAAGHRLDDDIALLLACYDPD